MSIEMKAIVRYRATCEGCEKLFTTKEYPKGEFEDLSDLVTELDMNGWDLITSEDWNGKSECYCKDCVEENRREVASVCGFNCSADGTYIWSGNRE